MAVNSVPSESTVTLKFQVGVDGGGDPIFDNKYLHHVKPDALDQDLYDIAAALDGLVDNTLDTITREDVAELINEV
ncbi:MAG: DUF1659 domain-containing protein [Clostridiales bacterium]|nr:DUF1659 domain-containing protein [Clostridiales bacterium]MCF8023173.1 DUF1659 domain-containing protein [Clostridiales bacterium]